MSTSVSVNTYTHSVTYVADMMMKSIKLIILASGLDLSKFTGNWASTENAISTWLNSRHLHGAVVEIYNMRTGKLVYRWDINIDYSYGSGDDGFMWTDTDAIRYAIAKESLTPSQCSYDILLLTHAGRPDVSGWGPGSFRSTDGFVFQSLGNTIGTHALGAQTGYWRPR